MATDLGQNFSGLFGSGSALANQAQQVLAASGKANDPRFADSIVGSFTQNGVTYNVLGDGSIQGLIETPTGAYLAGGFTPEGQQATEQLSTRFEQTDLDRALGVLANAAIAAGTAAALGPAGVGALSTPAAAAAGAGVTNFANTADLQQALRAAALAGGAAYGAGQLFGGSPADIGSQQALELTIADDIASLANQGLSSAQISDIISSGYGIDPFAAAESVASTLGSSAVSPAAVTVTGTNLGALSNLAPALSSVLPSLLPQVQVTGQTIKPETTQLTAPEVISAAIPAVIGGTQQVGIEGTKVTTPSNETVASTVGAIVPSLTASVPTTAEQIQVTGNKIPVTSELIPATVATALPALSSTLNQPLPKPTDVKKEDGLFKSTDVLKLLTLLGGTAAAGSMGAGTIPTGSIPPSDTMIGSTTPQFGPDYYAAVQRYYNAYMPETPRDVAGPLQQWYENKYGA